MSFGDELRKQTRSKSDIHKEGKERIRMKAEESAIEDYNWVKTAFRNAAENGNYIECGTRKEIVVYSGHYGLERRFKNFASSSLMMHMRVSENMNREVSHGFFRRKTHVSYTFSVVPKEPYEYECYMRKIQELAQKDTIDIQEVVVYANDMREYTVHFPWIYTTKEPLYGNNLYPCLKFRIKY